MAGSNETGRADRRTWNAGRPLVAALIAFALLFGGLGIWSTRAEITGAVIGAGMIEKATVMTAVQHPVGGVVEEIYVNDGDRVGAGDMLLRLDGAELRSDLKGTEGELWEVLANIGRLEAVIEDRREMRFHPLFEAALRQQPDLLPLVRRQEAQLADHFATLATQRGLLDQQIAQIGAQIAGVEAELAAKLDERDLMALEIEKARTLAGRQLINLSDLYDLERKDVSMRGAVGSLQARLAELRGRVAELRLERHGVAPELREKAADALARQRPLRARYLEARVKLLDELAKLEIRAPIPGTIHDFRLQGRRSVAVAAKPLMMIVPEDDTIQVLVRVASTDIDQVYVGQPASLRFNAYSVRDIPIVLGTVSRVSADAFQDTKTRKFHYEVAVELIESEVEKLGGRTLVVGMPVDAYLATVTQTPMDYVLAPLQGYLSRAFRDT